MLADRLIERQLEKMNRTLNSRALEYDDDVLLNRQDGNSPSSSSLSGAEKITAAFKCVSDDEFLAPGPEIVEALWYLNHPYLQEDWLHEAIEKECGSLRSIDAQEFVRVVHGYEKRKSSHVQQAFGEGAGDSCFITAEQLPDLLMKKLKLPLMPGAAREVTGESQPYVDSGTFEQIYEDILGRAGLTVGEYDRLCAAFEACKADGADSAALASRISSEDLSNILAWHEHLTDLVGGKKFVSVLSDQAAQASINGTCSLDLQSQAALISSKLQDAKEPGTELRQRKCITISVALVAARVLHDHIERSLRDSMGRQGSREYTDDSGLIHISEELGFVHVLPTAIDEFLPATVTAGQRTLDFDQAYSFVLNFCFADGVTDSEGLELNEIFKRFDADNSGALNARELGPVIRWLGYQPSLYRIYHFAEMMELTENTRVSHAEFRRLVSKYQRMSLIGARRSFMNAGGSLSKTKLGQTLRLVGYEPTEEEVADVAEEVRGQDGLVTFCDFKRLEKSHRKRVRQTMVTNGGVSTKELAKYKERFHRHDPQGSGFLTQKTMRELMACLFPDTATCRERSIRLGRMIKEADADGNGQFDFEEYIDLMRNVVEDIDRDSLVSGLRLKHELGYKNIEVKQFLDLYNLSDQDMSGSIDVEELVDLFSNLVPMTQESKREIYKMFEEVDDGNGELDFWEFLAFMRKVQDKNWRNINGVAAKSGQA